MGELGPLPLSPFPPPPPPLDEGGGPPATIAVTVERFAPPDKPTDIPKDHLQRYFRDTASQLESYGVPHWAAGIASAIAVAPIVWFMFAKDVAIAVLKVFLPAVAGVALDTLDEVRKTLDPEFGGLAVTVLNELLGTQLEPGQLKAGEDFASHIARAQTIGALFHNTLLQEFSTSKQVTPEGGKKAAEIFSGLVINFGTATGILATIGGMAPFIHLDDVRLIGEDVAKNLGLGRLHRVALRPIIDILIAEPYKWLINEAARPTQFTLGDVVNPFAGTVMDPKVIWESLAREGYSDEKIKALLELHRKKLAEADAFTLWSHGIKSDEEFIAYLRRLGYSETDANDRKEAEFLRAEDPLQKELVSALVDAYKFGNIQRDELEKIVNSAVQLPNERALILLTAEYKRKVPHRSLTVADLEKALIEGVIDLTEFTDQLSTFGFSDDDVQVLLFLTLLKLGKQAEAQKVKAARAKAKTTKAAAKLAAGTTPKTP